MEPCSAILTEFCLGESSGGLDTKRAKMQPTPLDNPRLVAKILSYLGPCKGIALASKAHLKMHNEEMSRYGKILAQAVPSDLWREVGLPPVGPETSDKQYLEIQREVFKIVKNARQFLSIHDKRKLPRLPPEIVSIRPGLCEKVFSLLVADQNKLLELFGYILPEVHLAKSGKEKISWLASTQRELRFDGYSGPMSSVPGSIGYFKTLTGLDLAYKNMTELPEWIASFTALTNLNLARNDLAKLPESIARFTALTHLELACNGLTELPGWIGALTALTHLGLSHNDLTELPKPIPSLTALTHLGLSHNNLTELPKSIGDLKALTDLDLGENNLTELHESIGALPALTNLNLACNGLTKLPKSIGDLKALTHLDLSHNDLTELPESIEHLPSLRYLKLNGNFLRDTPTLCAMLARMRQKGVYVSCDRGPGGKGQGYTIGPC